ncbi:hypothetical protein BJ944DRAFT_235988 [Cunninghamella echinulata]|nr:hypothetical protein BJ944DRAFT_235988 [Cunninghamella echinulata]
MDTEKSKKHGVIERQTTFGPSAPIDEWELEKATIVRESKLNKERAERLQQQLEGDRRKFERNTSKLLKEVKLKEATWEKHRQETDERWMKQILELQQQLEDERLNHEESMKDMKQHISQALITEQEKHDRRVANLHERLAIKEKLLEKYLNSENTSSPSIHADILPSPMTPSILQQQSNEYTSNKNDNDNDYMENKSPAKFNNNTFNNSNKVQLLQRQLKEEKEKYKLLEKKYEAISQTTDTTNNSTPLPSLPPSSSPLPSPITPTFSTSLSSPSSTSNNNEINHELMEMEYKKKIQSLIDSHNEEKKRLQSYFMNENSTLTMHSEAKLQNLQSEYEDILREMKDQFNSEKEVWRIEQQTQLDELKRQLNEQYLDQQRESETVWRNKIKDIETSLSQDGLAIQSHWEAKIDLLTSEHEKELLRLRGELDVVKSRLGKDIDRRHLVEKKLKDLEITYQQQSQSYMKLQDQLNSFNQQKIQLSKAMKDYELVKNLAMKLLPTTSIKNYQHNNSSVSVVDILQQAIHYVTRLQTYSSSPKMTMLESYEYIESYPIE